MKNVPFDPEMLSHLEGVSDGVITDDLAANYTQEQLQRMISSARRLAELATAELADRQVVSPDGPLPNDIERILRMVCVGTNPDDIVPLVSHETGHFLRSVRSWLEDVIVGSDCDRPCDCDRCEALVASVERMR